MYLLSPLVLSVRLCGKGFISLQREQLCQMLVAAQFCGYHHPLDILSSSLLQVHFYFPSAYSWGLFYFPFKPRPIWHQGAEKREIKTCNLI